MFQRFAIYYTSEGALAACAASWLGWDIETGTPRPQPQVAGLNVAHLTQAPRRYGFHGTIKPPFALADGKTPDQLSDELQALCAHLAPIMPHRLEVTKLSGFVALTPVGDTNELGVLAATVLKALDTFRAPPTETELARRRRVQLSPTQERNLRNWGYPFVLEEFRFHMTLTGRIEVGITDVVRALRSHFAPHLSEPVAFDHLALVGQDESGFFRQIERYKLTGEA